MEDLETEVINFYDSLVLVVRLSLVAIALCGFVFYLLVRR